MHMYMCIHVHVHVHPVQYKFLMPSSQYDIKPRVHCIMCQNRNTFYLDALDMRMYYWARRMGLHHIVNQALDV